MAKKTQGGLFVATESGEAALSDGTTVRFTRGVTHFREGHLALTEHPTLFRPATAHYEHGIEDATDEPGEKRGQP